MSSASPSRLVGGAGGRAVGAFRIGLVVSLFVTLGLQFWVGRHRSLDDDDLGQAIAARHILAGCGLPLHPYGGPTSCGASLHAWMAAPIFAIFGPTENAMKAAILVPVAVLAWLFYAIAARAVLGTGAGTVAGASACAVATILLTSGIPNFAVHLLMAHHHSIGVLFMLVEITLFDRIGRAPSSRRALLLSGGAGLVGALAFWASAGTLTLTAPLLFLLAAEPRGFQGLYRLGAAIGAGAGALVGLGRIGALTAFEVLQYGVPSGGAEFILRGLRNLAFIAGDRFADSFRAFLELHPAPYMDAAFVIASAWALSMPLARLAGRSRWRPTPAAARIEHLCLLQIAMFFLAFSFSRWMRDTPEVPKYFLYTYPSLILVGTIEAFRAPRAVRWAMSLGVAVLVVFTQAEPIRYWNPEQRVPKAIRCLKELGIDRVYSEYWLAWQIVFHSQETILATSDENGPIYLPYDEAVWRAPRYAVVLWDYGPLWSQVRKALKRAGVHYSRRDEGGVHILYDFEPDARASLADAVPGWSPIVARTKARPLPPVLFRGASCPLEDGRTASSPSPE